MGGPNPGLLFRRDETLFIPAHYQRVLAVPGGDSGVFYTHGELTGRERDAAALHALVAAMPIEATAERLAAMNLALFRARLDPAVHNPLGVRHVRPGRLRDMQRVADRLDVNGLPNARVVFHRGGLLAGLKALLAFGAATDAPADPFDIGELALFVNEFVPGGDRPPAGNVDALTIVVEFLPTWELYNPPDLGYGLARTHRLLRELLWSDDDEVRRLRPPLGITRDTTIDGLSVEAFVAVAFGLVSLTMSLPQDALVAERATTALRAEALPNDPRFPRQHYARLLEARSRTATEFRDAIRAEHPAAAGDSDRSVLERAVSSPLFGSQMLLLKRHPLMRLRDGRFVVLDMGFLSDLAMQTPFWNMFDGLPGRQRPDFLSLWGRLVELYVGELLGHAYPHGAGVLSLGVRHDRGEIDALLDFGERLVIIECKSAFLPQPAKYGRDRAQLEAAITAKFVEDENGPRAVRQLAHAIEALGRGAVRTILPRLHRKIIYPVLVGLEPSLESFGVNLYLNARFRELQAAPPENTTVRPLTVMSVEELEELLASTAAGLTWWDVLDYRYGAGEVPLWSVGQSLFEVRRTRGLGYPRNEYVLQVLERIYRDIRVVHQSRDAAAEQ